MRTTTNPPPVETVADLNARLDEPVARPSTPTDTVQGVRPRLVVEPTAPEHVSQILAWATETGRTVIVRGGGTKIGWAPTPSSSFIKS